MEDSMLSINYPNGNMTINMMQFFPATGAMIRKLYKSVISLVWDIREQTEITDRILKYVDMRARECGNEELLKALASESVSAHTRATELEEDIVKQSQKVDRMKELVSCVSPADRKTYKDSLKAEKEELSRLKQRKKDLISHSRFYQNEFNQAKSRAEKFKQNYELVMKLADERGLI